MQSVVSLAIGLFLLFLFLFLGYLAIRDWDELNGAWPALAAMEITGLVPAFLLLRAAHSAVVTSASEVIVRNPLKTVRVPWTAVQGFSLERSGIFPKVGFLELRDGRRVRLYAIQGPNPDVRPRANEAENIIEALNAEHRRAIDARGVPVSTGAGGVRA